MSELQKCDKEIKKLIEKTNKDDVEYLKNENRFEQIEANASAGLELIETLSDKHQLIEESMSSMREQISKRLQAI